MKWTKLEISLAVGLLCALVWCAAQPQALLRWWGVAFAPLCDGVLTAESSGDGIVLRSFLAQTFAQLLG